jgi:small subunit ribosomal protein S20
MNKKQKNRKVVTQNLRNRIENKRYSSTTKSLTKLFLNTVNEINNENDITKKQQLKTQLFKVLSDTYSIIDKSVKKGVFHKNNAARKKSKINQIYKSIQC